MSRKLLVTDKRGERELLLVGTMSVGRDPACDISDADPLLSRHHAEFRVTGTGVVVRDLDSQNGIQVNGIELLEATLNPGDVVQVAGFRIRYLEDDDRVTGADEDEADETVLLGARRDASHRRDAVAETGEATSGTDGTPRQPSDEKTVFLPPPPEEAGVERGALTGITSPRGEAAGDDRTVFMPPPVEVAAGDQRPVPEAAAPHDEAAPAADARPQAPPAPVAAAGVVRRHVLQVTWSRLVLLEIVGLTTLVFLLTAIPVRIWQNRGLSASGIASATAHVNWLAADAAGALERGGVVSGAADGVARAPGVVTAVMLSPDGHVLSPASRATESIAVIPAIGRPPADILRPQYAWHGSVIEIARPVRAKDVPRAAIAWITFRPSAVPGSGSVVLAFGPSLLIALACGFLVAEAIRRRTLHAFSGLSEDIELSLGGQLASISDPLGAKPVQDLIDTVNYLIARLKTQGDAVAADGMTGTLGAVGRAQAAGSGTAETRTAPEAAIVRARIETSPAFRVTEASPECAELLGVQPSALLGAHIVDAIPDKQIVDAVLKCLGAVGAVGEAQTIITPAGRPYRLTAAVSRAGKERPVTITFSTLEAVEKP